jgi:hypothetical protein
MRPLLRRLLPALILAGCTTPVPTNFPTVTPTTTGWVHSDGQVLRDEYGRQLLFRGINARVEGLFDVSFQDSRAPLEPIPEFTEDDTKQMAAAGFNLLRLPINWSGLEPIEGMFNQAYLDRLTQVLGWCRAAGIYVLVDFHQDAFSKEIGEDGAPLWAIEPPPTMLLGGPLNDLGERRQSAQVFSAFTSFFHNTNGLQDRFLPAWKKVTAQYAGESAVVGYEPMNEPVSFQLGDNEAALQAFYEKAATALRTTDTKHALWLEPDSQRNLSLSGTPRKTPFPDGNVVYAPHMYPQSFVAPPQNTQEGWVEALDDSFSAMLDEAASYGAATVLGEWGANPADDSSAPYVEAIFELLERQNMGEAMWLWKENSQGSWGFFDINSNGHWAPRIAGFNRIERPCPLAVPGTLNQFHFDATSGTFTLTFTARGGEAAPLVYLPSSRYPNGVSAKLNGKAIAIATGRVLLPWTGAKGAYSFEAKAN